jgi:hypothetical protein
VGTADRLADTQILVSYRGSPWVQKDAGDADPQAPRAGDRAPDATGLRRHGIGFPLRLFDVLRGTEHVLVAYVAKADLGNLGDCASFARTLRDRLRPWLRIAVVTEAEASLDLPGCAVYHDSARAFADAYGASSAAFLVRPDGYIGWRGRSWREPGLPRHLESVFGACDPSLVTDLAAASPHGGSP